jgi:hypothetical protein
MRAKTILKTIIFSFLIYGIIDTLNIIGVFKNVQNSHPNEKCKEIGKIISPEDLGHYKEDSFFVTSSDGLKIFFTGQTDQTEDGAIYFVSEAKSANPIVEKMEIENFPKQIAFQPFGFYVYQKRFIYVINRGFERGGERVEILEIIENK